MLILKNNKNTQE